MDFDQDVEQYINYSIDDPFRQGQTILIQVRTNDEESSYHARVARYLGKQETLLGYFYQHIDGMAKAKLQGLLLRAQQALPDKEQPALKAYMAKSMNAILGAFQMQKLSVNGTHVQALFHLPGISVSLDMCELMVPFTNLRIARDIDAIEVEDPLPFEQAA